jgi:xylulokinase
MYLSIDVGSTSTKAALYHPDGKLCGNHSEAYDVHYPHPGWAEQHPDTWWDATQKCCRRLVADLAGQRIEAIAVSGQAPGCVPIDRKGNALRQAILWMDRRAVPQTERLRSQLGIEAAIRISGNTLDSYFGGPKWMWFHENEPELYAATWKLLQANNYITYRLVGEAVTDPSQAGLCSPCFDLHKREWDSWACEVMAVDPAKLPRIRASTEVVGTVSRAASVDTGLPEGVPVLCGGGDFAFACLGAGVTEVGSAAMMLGTSGNLLVPGCAKIDPRLLNTVHVTGQSLSLGAVLAGGTVNWFTRMLGTNQPRLFRLLDNEASKVSPGADGLVFLPYLVGERTPIWDPLARGAFIGLSIIHTRAHLYRAVLEGVAYAFRQMVEIISGGDTPIREIIAIDGGARSAVWRQIFADVLQTPIRWRPTSGGTSLGAAYLAARSCQGESSMSDPSDWFEPTVDVQPNAGAWEYYRRQYDVFCGLYDRLRDSFPRLHTTAAD